MAQLKETCFSILKHPVIMVLGATILGLFFHPKLLNFHSYFRTTEHTIPMNYVSNFYLWTRQNSNLTERIIAGANDELKKTNFGSRKTYIIIHGFTRTGLDDWVIRMKNALLWRENCNVISVDWEAGSITVGYYVIKDRVHLVGVDISKLLTFFQTEGHLKPSQVHLIGHSLGAHIAGFAGKYFNGTIARITGLDPASLSYNDASASDRLDKSDASFVDVIHTHGCRTYINRLTNCYGTYDNIGHVDLWPNGGENQPACEEEGDGGKGIPAESNCNHAMAYVYFSESVLSYRTSTRFLARKCSSYELFNNGSCSCGNPPQYMGFNADPRMEGVFYLNTSHISPYGLLEPQCSPAEYSVLKLLGLTLCALLVAVGFAYPYLSLEKLENKLRNIQRKEVNNQGF